MSQRLAVSQLTSTLPHSSRLLLRPYARFASSSSSSSSSMTQPRFSPSTDESATSTALSPLLNSSGGRWQLAADGEALERSFKFKNFTKTWDFMTAVSLQCKLKNHHPEWSNVYSSVFIRWTTHSPKGLSDKDVGLASICDALAKDFGEVEAEPSNCELRNIANQATISAADCCAPKKSA